MPFAPNQQYDSQALSRGVEGGMQELVQGLKGYTANKQMASQALAQFEATVAANPDLLGVLSSQNAPDGASSAYKALLAGGSLPVQKAAMLNQFAQTFVTQKTKAQEQQAAAQMKQMNDAKMKQFLDQEKMDNLARAVGSGRVQIPEALKNNPYFRQRVEMLAAGVNPSPGETLDYNARTAPKPGGGLNLKTVRSVDEKGNPVDKTYDLDTGKVFDQGPLQSQPDIPNPMMEKIYTDVSTERSGTAIPAITALRNYGEISKILSGDGGKIVSGAFANPELLAKRIGNALGQDNVDVANTQTMRALFAQPVATMIKNFGSGTGLSDADRQFAIQAVGGDITLDPAAIKRLVKIGQDASRNILKNYNERLDKAFPSDGNAQDKRARAALELPSIAELMSNPETTQEAAAGPTWTPQDEVRLRELRAKQ